MSGPNELEFLSRVIVRFVTTEKAYTLAEKYNYLTVKVARWANKKLIKEAIEKLYGVKVVKVNTLIDRDGYKKAYVKLSPEHKALTVLESATR